MLANELSTEDLQEIERSLEEAIKVETGMGYDEDKSREKRAIINDLVGTSKELRDAKEKVGTDNTPENQEALKEAEEVFSYVFAESIDYAWSKGRMEIFHWDFLSDRVQTVLGDEFDIDVIHTPREPDADFDPDTIQARTALTPLVDAWVRGQYSGTQKYLTDNGIEELSLFRGLYIPNAEGTHEIAASRRDQTISRGLESWSYKLQTGLMFAGNELATATGAIEEIEDSGQELDNPNYVLLHDVVPARLVFGVGTYLNRDNEFTQRLSLGSLVEEEVVVLGNTRDVNVVADDFLMSYGYQVNEALRMTEFDMTTRELYDYLSGDERDQSREPFRQGLREGKIKE